MYCKSKFEAPEEAKISVEEITREKGRGAVKISCPTCGKAATLMGGYEDGKISFFEWANCHEVVNQPRFLGLKK